MATNEKDTPKEPEFNHVEVKFLFACLKHLDKDKMVDLGAVAAELNYSNVASVGNRLRALRKRYGFDNLEGKVTAVGAKTTSKLAAANDDKEDSDDTVEDEPKPKRKRGGNTKSANGSSKPAAKGAGTSKGAKRGPKPKQGGIDTALLAAVDVAAKDA